MCSLSVEFCIMETEMSDAFKEFIRIIGRGPNLSRSLSEEEAEQAMGLILSGQSDPVQLGAFLVVLRFRSESPEELAGFVTAARKASKLSDGLSADLDWPSYADRHKQLPYFVLSALLLAQNGVRVCMHGLDGEGPATTPKALAALGIEGATDADEASAQLTARNFTYMPLKQFCPELQALFDLRPTLGVRTPANSLARQLNPSLANAQVLGVFHPTYIEPHIKTAELLGQQATAIYKGGGGEAQRNPDKSCSVSGKFGDELVDEKWPALSSDQRYPWRAEELEPSVLPSLWRGEIEAPAPAAAVIASAAIALRALGKAGSTDEADGLAAEFWEGRDKSAF